MGLISLTCHGILQQLKSSNGWCIAYILQILLQSPGVLGKSLVIFSNISGD